ncbi:MAG: helix-turn-helix domain-containing protein [Bryobacterales bacterium]|nr:helix-turn-helix domain-containing protein [Bryobacterales bacterium]
MNDHVRRVRLERAALLLRSSPRKRITDAAIETGFAGTAEFSRAFRNHFGRTASSWDRRSPLEKSKICKEAGAIPFHTDEELRRWYAAGNRKVRIRRCNPFRYVYNRIYAPYGNTKLVDSYHALLGFLAQRKTDPAGAVFMGMSLDDPSITPAEKCRYDLGIAFPLERGGLVDEIIRSRGSKPAVAPERSDRETARFAWQYLYRIWLPESGLDPADVPAMEMFVKLPEEIG